MRTRAPRAEAAFAVALAGLAALLCLTPAARAAELEPPSAGADEFAALAERGLAAFEAERYAEALEAFDAALRVGANEPEAAVVALNAAACVFALGRYAEAEARFVEVARRWPEKAASARLNAGYAALFGHRLDAVSSHLAATAGDPALHAERADLARRLREARRSEQTPRVPASSTSLAPRLPLPAPGPSAWVLASGGYDDNAEQSGTNDALDGASEAKTESAFVTLQLQLDTTARASRRIALTPYYSADFTGLLRSSVADLSIQSHELGLRTTWALAPSAALSLTTAGSHVVSGLDSLESVLWELMLGTRLDLGTRSRFRTRLELASRASFGIGQHQALDGMRSDALASERVRLGIVELAAELRLRWLDVGAQRIALDPSAFSVCEPDCREYRIPLSYLAPGAGFGATVEPLEWLELSSGVRLEQRRYLEAHGVTGFAQAQKRRRDLRWRVRAGVEAELDRDASYLVGLDYTRLQNHSNVALDTADSEDWDYSDRNFVQNTLELGFQSSF